MSKSALAAKQVAEYQDKIMRCIKAALEIVKTDVSLRPPVRDEERANGFAAWIEKCHAKYLPGIEAIVHREFADTELASQPERLHEIADCEIWPEVRFLLIGAYALKYYAAEWVRKHLGDAVFLGTPVLQQEYWHIPLGVKNYGENLGQIVLDTEGNIIPPLTTTGEQLDVILDKINDRRFPPAKTAAR